MRGYITPQQRAKLAAEAAKVQEKQKAAAPPDTPDPQTFAEVDLARSNQTPQEDWDL